ncbi:adenylate kinase [Patescibacteria group bacterium]|nr:adenylate kinase [Patescibacteria group bacterium]
MILNRHFVIIGPQGSGKGTQAKRLAAGFGLAHISTGEIFRQAVSSGSNLGQQVKEVIDKGQLMPDDITNHLVGARLGESPQGFILDGYPRTLAQAEFLYKLMPDVLVINLALSDEEGIKRIAGRRNCLVCGAVYHIDYQPPSQVGICNKCGGALEQRVDDVPEVIKQRLQTYHDQTEPLLEFYKQKGTLLTIDGHQTIDQVASLIEKELLSRK